MLLRAVRAAGNGKRVEILGHETRYTDQLVRDAREYAAKCGIDPLMISPNLPFRDPEFETRSSLLERELPHVFEDHYIFDRAVNLRRAAMRKTLGGGSK